MRFLRRLLEDPLGTIATLALVWLLVADVIRPARSKPVSRSRGISPRPAPADPRRRREASRQPGNPRGWPPRMWGPYGRVGA